MYKKVFKTFLAILFPLLNIFLYGLGDKYTLNKQDKNRGRWD